MSLSGVHLVLSVPGWKLSPLHAQSREMLMMRCLERGIDLTIMPEFASGIDLARNIAVAKFLSIPDATDLLMIDSDLAFDPESVFAMLDANVEVCGALYPKKVVDYAAAAKASKDGVPDEDLRYYAGQFVGGAAPGSRRSLQSQDGKHRFVDADRLGTGFLLMKRAAIEKFIAHHRPRIAYRSVWEPKGTQHAVFFSEPQGRRQRTRDALLAMTMRWGRDVAAVYELLRSARAYVEAMEDEDLDVYQTEDFNFIYRAKEAGIGCWMYLDAVTAHQGTWVFEGQIQRLMPHTQKEAA